MITNILPPFYVSQSMYICMCYCVRFRNYFQGQRVEILDMFGKGSSSMLMVTWGLVYTVRVADLNVHRIIIFDLPTVAQWDMYLNILREYANVVDITTFAERNRDHRLAFALAQLINDVSIEHFVRKCVTAFYSDRPMSCNEFIADVSSYNNRTNVESDIRHWSRLPVRQQADG